MSRSSALILALLLSSVALPGCRVALSDTRLKQIEHGALMSRSLRSYHAIAAARAGHVGFLKVYDVTEQQGPTFAWKYVYDTDFNERGFVDQNGVAYRYHAYTGVEQEAHGRMARSETLPTDSLERNVMRILGMDPALDDVQFPIATSSDIAGK